MNIYLWGDELVGSYAFKLGHVVKPGGAIFSSADIEGDIQPIIDDINEHQYEKIHLAIRPGTGESIDAPGMKKLGQLVSETPLVQTVYLEGKFDTENLNNFFSDIKGEHLKEMFIDYSSRSLHEGILNLFENSSNAGITKIQINSSYILDDKIQSLDQDSINLQSIRLFNCHASGDTLAHMVKGLSGSDVKELTLEGDYLISYENIAEMDFSKTNITNLTLLTDYIEEGTINALNLKGSAIKFLGLSVSNITSEEVAHLESNLNEPAVESLFLLGSRTGSQMVDAAAFEGMDLSKTNIEFLRLGDMSFGESSHFLKSLPNLSLKMLIIQNTNLNDDHIKEMDFKHTNIEYLNLADNNITAEGFDYLKEAIKDTNIVEVVASYDQDDNPVVIKNDQILAEKEAEINLLCENKGGAISAEDVFSDLYNHSTMELKSVLLCDENRTVYSPELLDISPQVIHSPELVMDYMATMFYDVPI